MNWFLEEEDAPKPWTLADIYADLCQKGDIIRELGITQWRLSRWIERRDRIRCPHPVRTFANVQLYSMQEWKDWYAAWLAKHPNDTKWTTKAQTNVKARPEYDHDWLDDDQR